MAYASCTPIGCVIGRADRDKQQLALTKVEWYSLTQIHHEISQFLTGSSLDTGKTWTLPEDGSRTGGTEVRVSFAIFPVGRFVDLRVFASDKPTKQGVSLNEAHWRCVQTALGYSEEARLGRAVYTALLKASVVELREEQCEGCCKGWGSQKDHACTRDPTLTRHVLATLTPVVDPYQYAVELAQRARDARHLLERPKECYDLCSNFLRADIEAELVHPEQYQNA